MHRYIRTSLVLCCFLVVFSYSLRGDNPRVNNPSWTQKLERQYSLALSPNGQRLISGGFDMCVINANNGKILHRIERDEAASDTCRHIAMSDDGRYVGTVHVERFIEPKFHVCLWELTGEGSRLRLVRTLYSAKYDRRVYPIDAHYLSFSPSGTQLAFLRHDGIIVVWDCEEGKIRHELSTSAVAVSFSPDGSRLIAINVDGSTEIWDSNSGKRTEPPRKLLSQVVCYAKSVAMDCSRASFAITDSYSMFTGSFSKSGDELQRLAHFSEISCVAVSSKQSMVAIGAEHDIVLISSSNGAECARLTFGISDVAALAFSPDGRKLVAADREGIALWDNVTSNTGSTTKGPTGAARGPRLSASLSAIESTYPLDPIARSPSFLHQLLSNKPPLGPTVHLKLILNNRGKSTLSFRPPGKLKMHLVGPGAFNVPEAIVQSISLPERGGRSTPLVTLKPQEGWSIPVTSLEISVDPRPWWLSSGEYNLFAVYSIDLSTEPHDTPPDHRTFTSYTFNCEPLPLKITEHKR